MAGESIFDAVEDRVLERFGVSALALDEPLTKLRPPCRGIALRHLLSHRAGPTNETLFERVG